MIVIATFCTLDILIVFLFVIIWQNSTSSNYEFAKYIFLDSFTRQGVLNKDPAHWIDGAIPHPLVLMVVPLPESVFDGRHDTQQTTLVITTLSIMGLVVTLSINDTQHK